MKQKHIILFALLAVNIVIIYLAPRFGWTMHNNDPFNPYKYKGLHKVNGQVVSVYESPNSVLEIGYKNRFSREFEIIIDKKEVYTVKVNIDGGVNGTFEIPQLSPLDFAFSDIVWEDFSGLFYYRYLLLIGVVCGYIFCIIRSNQIKSFYFLSGLILYALSILMSLRVIF